MRILRFKCQLTIAFFAAVNHLNGPLWKQNFTLTGSKGHGFWFVIGGFRSVLCVSVFQDSSLVIVINIDGSEKRMWRRLLNFKVRMFVKSTVICKTKALHMQHTFCTFLCHSLHDYNVKSPHKRFYERRKHTMTDFSFFKLGSGPQEFNSRKIYLHNPENFLIVRFTLPPSSSLLKAKAKRRTFHETN